MTVATTISKATFVYTGVETTFPAGFRALTAAHVLAELTTLAGETIALTQGVNYSVAIDSVTGLATATRISFPAAAGTLRLWRASDYVQTTDFAPGEAVPSQTHEDLHDAHVLRLQEMRRDIDNGLPPKIRADAAGPLASRASFNAAVKGFMFLQTDDAQNRLVYYVKLSNTSGDWSAAMYGTGPQGAAAPSALGGPILTTQIATSIIAWDVARFVTLGYDVLNPDAAAWWKEVAAPGVVKPWHKQSANGRWWQMFNRDATPQAFGAKADSTGAVGTGTDDTAAIENWLSYTLQIGFRGRLKGMYRYKPSGPWLLEGYTSGILIQGDQRNGDGFILDAGYTLALEFGNGFYFDLDRVKVAGNVNGPVIKLGKDNFSDALNGCRFDLVVNNGSVLSGAEGVRINYACKTNFFITSNCGGTGRPGQPTTPGYGNAIRIRHACFCFFEVAGGQANVGLLLSDGFIFANTFAATNLEEVSVAVRCTSDNASKNEFISGQFVASTIFDFTAGNQNVFHTACNFSPYAGGALGANLVGVELKKDAPRTFEVTPTGPVAMPASNVYATNNTGISVFLKIWGGNYTAVSLKAPDGGVSSWNPQTTNEQTDLVMPPGWSIAITYSMAPAWRWLPI